MSQNTTQLKYQFANTGKRGRGRPPGRYAANNDVEQAVNSITYASSTPVAAARAKTNMSSVQPDKADKILFLPKYVQKKVTVIRDPPKKFSNSPGGSGQPPMKKKKLLGDLALQSWAAPRSNDAEEDIQSESPSLLCRVCGSLIEDTIMPLIADNGDLTSLGSKLKTIVGSDIAENPLYPTSCCKPCSYKINVCFTLLLELQASDEVVRSTYADLQEGDLINPTTHIYTCEDCEQEVVGTNGFIAHCEQHMQAKTIGGKTEQLRKPKEEEDDIAERAQMFLDEDVEDGSIIYQNEAGELICEKCGRTFKYKFLLQLHRKAPKRGHSRDASPPAKVCFVCKQARVSTVSSDGYCEHLSAQNEEDEDEAQPPIEFIPFGNEGHEEIVVESSEDDGTGGAPEPSQYYGYSSDENDEVGKAKKESKKPTSGYNIMKACPMCNKVMKKQALNAHIAKMHEESRFFCDYCEAAFPIKAMLSAHKRSHQTLGEQSDDYPVRVNCCHHCDAKFEGSLGSLREHLSAEHDEEWIGDNHFSCRQCRKPFDDFFHIRMHLMLYHNIELPKKFLKRKGSMTCDLCKNVLKSEYQLKLHLRQEHNLTPQQMESLKESCEECGKRFSVRMNLINHINSAHRQVKPLECEYCGERFTKCSSLIMHRRRHTGEKPFVCCVCHKNYRQRNDVLRHLARHVRDREVLFEEAYATNTSSSHRVTQRLIYLKDSQQKGINDLVVSHGPLARRVTKARRNNDADDNDESSYMYIMEDGGKLERVEEEEMECVVDESGQLVVQVPTTEETVVVDVGDEEDPLSQFVCTDGVYIGPDGVRYRLEENEDEDGPSILIPIEEDQTAVKQEFRIMETEDMQC